VAVAQTLLEAIPGSRVIGWPRRLSFARQANLHRSIDVPFSVADDTSYPPKSLELLQSPFGDPINQFAVGVVKRDLILHEGTRIL
jgi:hypothetical protein